jgi:hypothetical protein
MSDKSVSNEYPAEKPKIRRIFGMKCALPGNKSGFWKDEVLPEEVLDSLREEYSSTTRAASESRERRSEVAREQAGVQPAGFEQVRRESE